MKPWGGRRDAPGKVLKVGSAFTTPTRSCGDQCEIERTSRRYVVSAVASIALAAARSDVFGGLGALGFFGIGCPGIGIGAHPNAPSTPCPRASAAA